MKKLFSLLVVILCTVMLSFSAFAAEADAYALYQKSIKKLKSVSSFELPVVLKGSITGNNSVDVITLDLMNLKVFTTPDKKRQMEWRLTDPETNETSCFYYKDGYYYVNLDGEKIKTKRNFDMDEILDEFFPILDLNLTKDNFKGAQVKNVDGDTKIIIKRVSPFKSAVGLPDNTNATTKKDTLTITVGSDGMLKSCSFSSSEPIGGMDNVQGKLTLTLRVKSANSVKGISFPSDLNSYKELE